MHTVMGSNLAAAEVHTCGPREDCLSSCAAARPHFRHGDVRRSWATSLAFEPSSALVQRKCLHLLAHTYVDSVAGNSAVLPILA